MTNQELRKLLELLNEATDEITPAYTRGEEIKDITELDATGELYRYIEGLRYAQGLTQ